MSQEQICYFLTCVNCNDIFNYDIISYPIYIGNFLCKHLGKVLLAAKKKVSCFSNIINATVFIIIIELFRLFMYF